MNNSQEIIDYYNNLTDEEKFMQIYTLKAINESIHSYIEFWTNINPTNNQIVKYTQESVLGCLFSILGYVEEVKYN